MTDDVFHMKEYKLKHFLQPYGDMEMIMFDYRLYKTLHLNSKYFRDFSEKPVRKLIVSPRGAVETQYSVVD